MPHCVIKLFVKLAGQPTAPRGFGGPRLRNSPHGGCFPLGWICAIIADLIKTKSKRSASVLAVETVARRKILARDSAVQTSSARGAKQQY